MSTAWIGGVGATSFDTAGRSIKELSREAINEALADAGMGLDEIEVVFFANSLAGALFGQQCIRGETVTYALGMGNIPVTNVENACASAGSALHLARAAVASGQYNTALAIGAERMRIEEKAKTFAALAGATDVDDLEPSDEGSAVTRSPFIEVYAKRTRALMRDRGVTADGLARVAAKAWGNGAINPKAQRRVSTTPEKVLSSRVVVEPLTVDMCTLIADGAAAAVVRSNRGPRDVRVRASQQRTLSARPDDPDATTAAARAAFEESGIQPGDVDTAEVHDATATGEMISWVRTMLCRPGDEEKWAQTDHTSLLGALPVNPSGGLLARGHPIGATGLAQVYELVTQLRHEAGARQVPGARVAMAQVGGGIMAGTQTAVSVVHILSAD